jgi:hypothetical protein
MTKPKTTAKKTAPKPAKSADRARKAAIDEIQARIDAPETSDVPPQSPDVGPTGDAAKGPAKKAKNGKAPKAVALPAKNATAMKAKRLSGLDAAAMVLAEANKPMRCIDVLAEIQAKGLWRTTGKTPEATLYAAIIREIGAKKKDARFKKIDRGLFASNN